jgi:hypothetical protein
MCLKKSLSGIVKSHEVVHENKILWSVLANAKKDEEEFACTQVD